MDTGVDDALALVLAMNSPELDVVAVTTVAGNAPVEECTRNCLLLVELLAPSRRPVIAAGASAPLEKPLLTAPEVHGPDGLGGEVGSLPAPAMKPSRLPADELLASLPEEHPGEITLITTGPLTNVASALAKNPGAIAKYRRIVVMGGAFYVRGNTGPVAEFNFYVDPEAADAVMRSGLDITLVPLDATTRAPLMRRALPAIASAPWPAGRRPGRDLGALIHRALDYYMRYQFGESGLDGGYMHDPLAVASAIDPGLLTCSTGAVEVLPDGDDRGRTVLLPPRGEESNVRIAFDADDVGVLGLLNDRVLNRVSGA
jgi:purine nucleosidase